MAFSKCQQAEQISKFPERGRGLAEVGTQSGLGSIGGWGEYDETNPAGPHVCEMRDELGVKVALGG